MTSPIDALLRYGFGGEPGAVRAFADFMEARVRRARPKEPEDIGQTILVKLVVSPDKALLLARTLAKRNPGLAAALDAAPVDGIPVLPPDVLIEADRQLDAYIGQMIRNAEKDRWRRERWIAQQAEPELVEGPPKQLDDDAGLLGLRDRVLREILQDERRPPWLDEALAEIQALAEGTRTMQELTAACVAADPEFLTAPPEAARVRARNRLQQRHKRAREHLLATIRRLVAAGALAVDEGREAEKWLALLKRRQNRPRSPSEGGADA